MYKRPSDPVPFPLQREKIREKFVAALKTEFAGKGLRFSRGNAFPAVVPSVSGGTVYLWQYCLPCSMTP